MSINKDVYPDLETINPNIVLSNSPSPSQFPGGYKNMKYDSSNILYRKNVIDSNILPNGIFSCSEFLSRVNLNTSLYQLHPFTPVEYIRPLRNSAIRIYIGEFSQRLAETTNNGAFLSDSRRYRGYLPNQISNYDSGAWGAGAASNQQNFINSLDFSNTLILPVVYPVKHVYEEQLFYSVTGYSNRAPSVNLNDTFSATQGFLDNILNKVGWYDYNYYVTNIRQEYPYIVEIAYLIFYDGQLIPDKYPEKLEFKLNIELEVDRMFLDYWFDGNKIENTFIQPGNDKTYIYEKNIRQYFSGQNMFLYLNLPLHIFGLYVITLNNDFDMICNAFESNFLAYFDWQHDAYPIMNCKAPTNQMDDAPPEDWVFTWWLANEESVLSHINKFPFIWIESIDDIDIKDNWNYPKGNGTSDKGSGWQDDAGVGSDYTDFTPSDDFEDNNDYVDEIDLNNPVENTLGVFNNYWGMNLIEVNRLADFLFGDNETLLDKLKVYGSQPINVIASLRKYPFNVQDRGVVGYDEVTLGRQPSGANGWLIGNNFNAIFDFGTAVVPRRFNNFLDYSPNSDLGFYLPYIGLRNVDINNYLNRTVGLKYVVDITTGMCHAVIFANGIPTDYFNGIMGIEIEVNGADKNGYLGALISGVTGIVGGAVTSNPLQIATSITDSVHDINRADTNVPSTGTSTPNCSAYLPQSAYMFISRPIPKIDARFTHTFGNSVSTSGRISQFSGFSKAKNVDCSSITCTDSERAEIKRILESGFYT